MSTDIYDGEDGEYPFDVTQFAGPANEDGSDRRRLQITSLETHECIQIDASTAAFLGGILAGWSVRIMMGMP